MHKSLTALIASGVAAAGVAGGLGATAAVASAHGTHTPECTASQLSARITEPAGGGAAGNQYGTLTLTNTSHRTCETGGWVGLGLESANGRALGTHAIRTDRSGERLVVLRPHARTTSQLHWSDVDASTDHAGSACFVTPRHILVTPPNSRVSLSLRWTRGAVCSDGTIDVTPLAPTR